MIKVVVMLRKRPDMTPEEFMKLYETGHAVFAKAYLPLATKYMRRILKPEHQPLIGRAVEQSFDVITEIWFKSREDYERTFSAIGSPEISRLFRDDEKKLFASHENPVFTVEKANRHWNDPTATVTAVR